MLTEKFKEFIKMDARANYPNECCGLILNNGNIVSCKNISEIPEKQFVINNDDIFKYGIENIQSVYHSHKDSSELSVTDIAFSEKLKKHYILYCSDTDTFKEYNPSNANIPYEGRQFVAGALDCITLLEDYYRRELNIVFAKTVNDPIRFDNEFWVTDTKVKTEDTYYTNIPHLQNLLKDYLLSNDFVEVKEIQKHDVLIVQAKEMKFPTHLIIYLGNNKILTFFNRISKIEGYRKGYERVTKYIFRHKSLL